MEFHKRWIKDPNSSCYIWIGAKFVRGYAQFSIKGENFKASRIAYALHYGKTPRDLLVCHHCDNISCVNPKHLFLGTNQDNCDDKIRKNRHNSKKDIARNSKLNENDVLNIRRLFDCGLSYIEIQHHFNMVEVSQIRKICELRAWIWL